MEKMHGTWVPSIVHPTHFRGPIVNSKPGNVESNSPRGPALRNVFVTPSAYEPKYAPHNENTFTSVRAQPALKLKAAKRHAPRFQYDIMTRTRNEGRHLNLS